jgi:EAL domain-containing protein (putative c-di-GMP-specific phosphodiesterase class I)
MRFRNHALYPVFQPIMDIRKQEAMGVEALIRSEDGIAPEGLFCEAEWRGSRLALDRFCRTLAMQGFHDLQGCSQQMMLFMNVDVSSLEDSAATEGWIIECAEHAGLAHQQIALEIVESGISSNDKLVDFVSRHRQAGFLIVLDDFGDSHSNLNRIVQLKPDIIKIDKELIRDIHTDHYKQTIVSAVITLADGVGAITLAEGVETKQEIFACCELGVTLYQGYYFAMPDVPGQLSRDGCETQLRQLMPELNAHLEYRLRNDQHRQGRYETISAEACRLLSRIEAEPEVELASLIADHPEVDAIYLLDERGVQISETIQWFTRPAPHPLFAPAARGSSHAYRKYFYSHKPEGGGRFLSEPYISRASGHVCRTLSTRIRFAGKPCILCIDFLHRPDDVNHS